MPGSVAVCSALLATSSLANGGEVSQYDDANENCDCNAIGPITVEDCAGTIGVSPCLQWCCDGYREQLDPNQQAAGLLTVCAQ